MSRSHPLILHVLLPVPVRHHFDYLATGDYTSRQQQVGVRVRVPFGRNRQRTGIVISTSDSSEVPVNKLKPILEVLDNEPLFDKQHFDLLRWASNYYHFPLGELVFACLPAFVRQGKALQLQSISAWRATAIAANMDDTELSRAPKQQAVLRFLLQSQEGRDVEGLNAAFNDWRNAVKALMEKGLVEKCTQQADESAVQGPGIDVTLNKAQQLAWDSIATAMASPSRILLDGITGSGKTELYLEAIRLVVQQGKQALVLVPEIGLTPQFIARFRERVPCRLVVMHSGLSDGERLQAWLQARAGLADVILGTRSAIWVPLHKPGLFVVDEEHDPSYKQQESFRYSARDIAILRASNTGAPIILGSATPSLESLHNVELGKLQRVSLNERAGNAVPPRFRIVDIRGQQVTGALSAILIQNIKSVIEQNKQVLLFQNRRGYSPVMMCHDCGWIHICTRCDIPMTYHKSTHRVICHHCSSLAKPVKNCLECDSTEMVQIGHGTERLNETLQECFPDARIVRIDRDTTRRKDAMRDYMDQINAGDVDIMVGTQMLAKGHHFPGVTLVGIIDADRGLYSNDFRASERMAQIIVQVSGRAGRAADPGLVMIQTHHPDHPFLTSLIRNDYHTFANMQLAERKLTGLPPYAYQAMLRAEDNNGDLSMAFLNKATTLLRQIAPGLEVFGPFPAPIEKRAGRYRFQLLIQSVQRAGLQNALLAWMAKLDAIGEGKKIRWSLDVDPQETL